MPKVTTRISEEAILNIVEEFLNELWPMRTSRTVTLDSHLVRDLHLDSLSRLELIQRIEHTFNVTFTQSSLRRTENISDLFRRLAQITEVVESPQFDKMHATRLDIIDRQMRRTTWEQIRSSFTIRNCCYTGYTLAVFGLAMGVLWLRVMLVRSLETRRVLAHRTARAILRFARIPLQLEGIEHLQDELLVKPAAHQTENYQQIAESKSVKPHVSSPEAVQSRRINPVVVVANHASYIDGAVLTAALPPKFAYVVKGELEGTLAKGSFLQFLGAIFIDRFCSIDAPREITKILVALEEGHSIAIFPEGTFRSSPGLLPFHMGAFVVAAQAGVSLVPITICGTRSILCGSGPFLMHGEIRVIVSPPLRPQGADWSAALALRAAARAEILRNSREPDLEGS
jgi:1-acyl-sn-glycerol-3-phosphate acyltransferase